VLLASSIAAVAWARPRAVASTRSVTESSDVFALPPPAILNALSLGYRSALADLLYTSTVISYGIHHEQHRRFEFVGHYLDGIVALDPSFCQPYRYADLFIVYQPIGAPSPEDIRHARRLLEKGLEACRNDGQLWLSAGQFMAFIGTQFLTDEEEVNDFRVAGAQMLARAAELATDNLNAQWQTLVAAGIFTRQGKRDAAISFLNRVYDATDDLDLKEDVSQKLRALRREADLEKKKKHEETFKRIWQKDFPFVSRTGQLVVGPPRDTALCAGEEEPTQPCPRAWTDLGSIQVP
jgi:hypothetical protein